MEIEAAAHVFGLEQEDVRAATGYAAKIVSQEAIYSKQIKTHLKNEKTEI